MIELYNAIEGTDYGEDTEVEINTLEDVLYNGKDDIPEKQIMKLSDAFIEKDDIKLELRVKVININYGKSSVLQKSKNLNDYSYFIYDIQQYLKNGPELKNITDLVDGSEFGVFQNAIDAGGSVRGINAEGLGSLPRKQLDKPVGLAKTYGAKGLAWIVVNEGGYKTTISKFFDDDKISKIAARFEAKAGDLILICADKNKVVYDALGALRLDCAKRLELIKDDDYRFLWVTEFPMLEYSEEEQRYVAVHHPFTAPMDEDLQYLDTDPGRVRAKAYDMVLNGCELGGGSIRIHRQDIQSKMFELLGFTPEDAQERFGFLLDAFKYGAPPHGGLAFGFDRMIMLLSGADSIRDVMAFPKVKDASCLLTDAPNVVEQKQLDELGISIKE